MTKKAFLVSFSPMTRVVIDTDKNPNECDYTFGQVVSQARDQIREDISDYINGDNVDFIEEDDDCPYDPETDD
jgi:hypothetical protein